MWIFALLLTSPRASAQEETLWDRIREAAEDAEAEDGANSAAGRNGKGEGKPPPAEEPGPLPEPSPERAPSLEEDVDTAAEEDEAPPPPTIAELLLQVDRKRFEVPIAYTPEVIQWLEHFTGPGRSTIRTWMARSTIYKDLIQGELIQARLPTDLLYLAMIESGFSVHARSHADAVGPWQFIESTALGYGLRVDEDIDERRDPVRSTRAAIRYLRKLKNDFGNWNMAFAAYNAGEGLVFSAIRSYGTIDYWALVRAGALPQETASYVPKMHAALIIAKNPELFGFTGIGFMAARPLEGAEVDGGLTVAVLAESAGMDEAEFRTYNPHILSDSLPDEPEQYTIWLPPGSQRAFFAALENRPVGRASEGQRIAVEPEPEIDLSHHIKQFEDGQPTSTSPLPVPGSWVSHQLRTGESLAAVAQRYDCTIDELRGWNAIEADSRPAAGQVLWLKTGGE